MIHFSKKNDDFSLQVRRNVFQKLAENDHRFANSSLVLKLFFWAILTSFFYFLTIKENQTDLNRIIYGIIFSYSLFFTIVNASHDSIHGCFWRSRKANEITHIILFNLLGINSKLWGMRHLKSHHLFPNIPGCDSDIDETIIIRLSPHSKWRSFYKWQHLYAPFIYAILPIHSVFYQDFIYLRRKSIANITNIKHSKIDIFSFFLFKIMYLTLWIFIPWLLSGKNILEIAFGYLIVNFVLGFAFIPIAATHLNAKSAHPKLSEDKKIDTSFMLFQLASSLDWAPKSYLATFFYGGLNAHAAHHLFPRISHRHYNWITSEIEEECRSRNIEYHSTTFWGGIRSHFKYLYLLGNNRELSFDLKGKN